MTTTITLKLVENGVFVCRTVIVDMFSDHKEREIAKIVEAAMLLYNDAQFVYSRLINERSKISDTANAPQAQA